MVVGSYIPRWVKVFDGTQGFDAIAFVVNRNYPHYVGNLSLETTVNSIATAGGQLGSCADYLIQTVNGLKTVGIKDRQLLRLRDKRDGATTSALRYSRSVKPEGMGASRFISAYLLSS